MDLRNTLYALDRQSGSVKWSNQTIEKMHSSPIKYLNSVIISGTIIYSLDKDSGFEQWSTDLNGINSSSSFLCKDILLTCVRRGDNNRVVAHQANNGNKIWEYQLSVSSKITPMAFEDKVYVFDSNNIHCLNVNTGSVDWTMQTPSGILKSPTISYDKGEEVIYSTTSGFYN